jgi:transposase
VAQDFKVLKTSWSETKELQYCNPTGVLPDRFENGKQGLKLAGYDLSADRSGKSSDRAIPEISKRGKADLRYALYQAALVASLKNLDVMIYYTNKIRGREREKGI